MSGKRQRERYDSDDNTRDNRSFSFAQLCYLLFHVCVRVCARVCVHVDTSRSHAHTHTNERARAIDWYGRRGGGRAGPNVTTNGYVEPGLARVINVLFETSSSCSSGL